MQIPFWVKSGVLCLSVMVAAIFMVMGILVIQDDVGNHSKNQVVCYGNVTNIVTDSAGICHRASVDLWSENNIPTTLDFPAINWMLACENEESVNEWLDDLDGGSFDCWTSPPLYNWNHSIHGRAQGIRDQYNTGRIIGWKIMMSLGIIWLGGLFVVMCCISCCSCCNGECRCFSWSIIARQ